MLALFDVLLIAAAKETLIARAGLKGRDGKKGHALTQNLSSVGAESLSQLLLVGRKEELTLLLSKVSRLKTLQKRDRGSSSGRKVRRSTIQDESGGTVADYESLISASPKEDPGQSFRAKNKVALAALKSPSMESARDGALRPTPRSQSFAQPGSAAARALTSAATSAGVVLILGQAGIGKSSLISMMRAQIEAQNPEVQVVMTSGGSGGLGQQVLGPWIRLVLSRLELPPEFSPEQRGQAVVKHLPNLLQSQAYVLNDALKMSAPQSVTPNSPSRAGTNFGANESPSVSFAPTPQHNALPTLNLLGRVPLSADEPPTPLAPLEEDPTDEQRPRGKRRFSRKASLKRRGRGLGLLESELQNLRGPLRRMSMPGGGESPDPESIAPGGLPPLPGTVVETPERERHSSDAGTPNEHPRRGNRFVTMALGGYDHTEIAPPRVDGSAGSTPDAWEDSPLPGRRGTRFMTHAGGASPGLKEGGRLAQGQTKREVRALCFVGEAPQNQRYLPLVSRHYRAGLV